MCKFKRGLFRGACGAVSGLWVGVISLGAQSPTADSTVVLAEIRVIGSAAELGRIPGSATLVSPEALRPWRAQTANEVLRQVPGITIREEEGLGLRPNIGMRGLSPTRSTKVLLLEDGIPVTFAPYGDNASYYHPPISRFDQIEVLRGAGQIAFGPQTVGGVINYITPAISARPGGRLSLSGGSRNAFDAQAMGSTHLGPVGVLAMASRRQSDGARENTGTGVDDLMLKASTALGARQGITLRGNVYRERSNVTYSGLTEDEWAANPFSNPFSADSMRLDRWAASATHALALSGGVEAKTVAYFSFVDRDWWRQSSNSGQRPNDGSDPACGGMANLSTTCGNEGRLRSYRQFGVEPRLKFEHGILGRSSELEAGVRWHVERQDRRQVNGATPNAREAGPASNANSGLREDNLRDNTAWSGFVQQRTSIGRLTLTPGVRVEHVLYERTNRLNGVSGATALTEVIPGAGATYDFHPGLLLFGGGHRGFSPPRTEDVIDNSTGATVDLDPELSWNYEAGIRGRRGGLNLEFTLFRMDFENQIIPASVAGGSGATFTNSGRTVHQGAELGLRFDGGPLAHGVSPYFETSMTWLPTARFEGDRFAYVSTSEGDLGKVYASQNGGGTRARVNVGGQRLPYAPETSYSFAFGIRRLEGFDLRLERFGFSTQFTDPTNTRAVVPDGQQGAIEGYGVWNLSASHPIPAEDTQVFLSLRNVTDALYIADRTRGLLPGMPRTLQLGVRTAF
jgi:Fe(3+) dicitrate transport protein